MTATIRPARPDDVDALATLAAITFPLAAPDHSVPEALDEFIATHLTAAHFVEHLADADRAVLVAELAGAGAPVGYAMLRRGDPTDPDVAAAVTTRPTIDLNKLYVHPDHHGDGTAGALMAAALDAARSYDARSVWLGVNEENGRAKRFYAKQGFVAVGRRQFLVGGRYEQDDVLERPLP